jgi:hypothetical protein
VGGRKIEPSVPFDETNSGHYVKLIPTRLLGELTEKEKIWAIHFNWKK